MKPADGPKALPEPSLLDQSHSWPKIFTFLAACLAEYGGHDFEFSVLGSFYAEVGVEAAEFGELSFGQFDEGA